MSSATSRSIDFVAARHPPRPGKIRMPRARRLDDRCWESPVIQPRNNHLLQNAAYPSLATTLAICAGEMYALLTLLRLESKPTIWKPLNTLWCWLKSSLPPAPS